MEIKPLIPRYFKVVPLCLLFVIFFTSITSAQETVVITKINVSPELDGNLFEPVWDQLPAFQLIMLNPNSGGPASEHTEFKIACSDQYLFFAAFNYDSEPGKIQSSSKKRDELQLNNDWSGILLDSYNDHENALAFYTTPAGLRLDMQIINDGEGDFPVNVDWNALWEVETLNTEKGWFAEFRIPLSTLRYQVIDGKVVMGLAVTRYISRKSEWNIYPAIPNTWGFWSWAKVSQFAHTELHDVKAVNPLYFSPFVLGGYQQVPKLNEAVTAYKNNILWDKTAGMDIKYGIAKNLTLDLTINTDFAQVEADNQEINLTRFSLFFPEKRQFFMERANVFDFNFGQEGQLFYSRTIGLYDGQHVHLWGGGRVTGRAGQWDLGAMSLQTGFLEGDSVRILESANHSVLRMRRQIPLNKNSYIGFMGTSRMSVDGKYNVGYGVDAILNLKSDTYLKIALAQTVNSDSLNNIGSLDPARYQIYLEKRTFKGLSYNLDYERAGISYNPGMGFEFRRDFSKFGHTMGFGIIPPEASKIARIKYSLTGEYYFRNSDMSLETLNLTPSYNIESKQSTSLFVSFPVTIDDVSNGFNLSDDIAIPSGKYKNIALNASYSTSQERMIFSDFSASTGKYYGGWSNSVSVSPTLGIGNTWRFALSYYYYRIEFSKMNQVYQTQLMRFRMWYMLNTRFTAMGYVQYNSLNESLFVNARIRYNRREGNDLYIVYNDALNTNRYDFNPVMPFSGQRTIIIKYTHTFRIR